MTEYGRDDSRAKERTPNREALSKAYKLGDFISRQTVKEMSDAWGDGYSQIVESLNYNDMLRKFEGDMRKFKKAYEASTNPEEIASKSNASKNINNISDKTEAFGVEISKNSEEFWQKIRNGWQQSHPTGIVAYRKYGDKPETFSAATVNQGWIGNPFSTTSKGEDTVQKFYDWIVSGETFGNPRTLEEFRQAIIQKILSTPNDADVLYYTELGRPSHATVIGYLIKNKDLLKPQKEENSELTEEEQKEAEEYKKLCEGE